MGGQVSHAFRFWRKHFVQSTLLYAAI